MSTELRTQIADHTDFGRVPDGKIGNVKVALNMVRLVRESVLFDEGLERWLKQRLVEAKDNSYTNPTDLFKFIFDLVHKNVAYIEDIAGNTESIKDARRTLEDGFGDCDDQAVLVATLLAMLGYEPSFILASTDPTIFQHVYTILNVDGKRYAFDTTLPDSPALNKEISAPYTQQIDVFGKVAGLDDLKGLFAGVRHLAKATVKNATDAVGFMPIGFVATTSIKQFGKNFLNGVTGEDAEDSLGDIGSDVTSRLSAIINSLNDQTISVEAAQSQAHEIQKDFLTLRPNATDPNSIRAYNIIAANVDHRMQYINSFGNIAPDVAIHANADLIKLLGLGAVVFGIYSVIKQK